MAYSTSQASLSSLRTELLQKLKDVNYILVAVVFVLAVAFISLLVTVQGLVITYQKDNAESYQDYRNELRNQNEKIDTLTNEIKIQNSKLQSASSATPNLQQ